MQYLNILFSAAAHLVDRPSAWLCKKCLRLINHFITLSYCTMLGKKIKMCLFFFNLVHCPKKELEGAAY